jgi:hypothetical protein
MAIDSVLYGFGFRMRSGKDTAIAAILQENERRKTLGYPEYQAYDMRRYGFGDAVKAEVNQAVDSFPPPRDIRLLWDKDYWLVNGRGDFVQLPPWVKYDPNPDMTDPLCPYGKQRLLLQWWGTEFRRHVNPDYWVTKLKQRLEKDKPQIALINDLRFPNEFAFVKSLGEVVRVDRPALPPIDASTHCSECALADVPDEEWSRILINDCSLEEFKARSVEAFDVLLTFFP